ncbi:MAG: TIGR02206 family membrane protein [bacterium]|nr:TIGR02206 family membrane protein [bacterium]
MTLASAFKLFNVPHLSVITLTVLLTVLLVYITRKANSPRLTKTLCWTIAIVLIINELCYYVIGITNRTWLGFVQESLPLHLCGLALYLTAIALVTKKQFIFELACYWGLVGTPQAILTPTELEFPGYWFYQFFICHCGIVVGMVFAIAALKMRPRRGSAWRIFAVTNVCLAVIGLFDYLTGANYMYLCAAPKVDSPLVAFGWPWHVIIAWVGMLVGFLILERFLAPKDPTDS